jgi:tripartite-type tricarboxylate transporter receptor subunit TctC
MKKMVSMTVGRVIMYSFFLVLFPVLLQAQQYPTKPVNITIGFGPGSGMDLCVRALASASEKYFGQPFVVVNTPGGGGSVAYSIVAKQAPDGYHIMGNSTSGFIYVPHLRKVPYTLQDFIPICLSAKTPHKGIFVKGDAPWKTFKELVAYAKANPGKLKYSHSGIGSVQHIAAEAIAVKEGIQWTGIPYGSSLDAMMAALGGHVDFGVAGLHESWDHVKGGKARVLAVLDDNRCTELAPDAPLLKELGYNFTAELDVIMAAPKGTPAAIVKKLEDAFSKGVKDPEYIKAMQNLSNPIVWRNSADTQKYLVEAIPRLGRLIKELKIPTEADAK